MDGLLSKLFMLGIFVKMLRTLYRFHINCLCCAKYRVTSQAVSQRALYVQCTYIVRTVGTMYVHCTYSARWDSTRCGIHQRRYMCLIKYTVSINSLIIALKKSETCSRSYRTPNSQWDIWTICPFVASLNRILTMLMML